MVRFRFPFSVFRFFSVQVVQIDKMFWHFLFHPRRYRDTTVLTESEHIQQKFDGKTATLHVSRVKRNLDSGVYKCVLKNDSGMDETSATITVKKVEAKKKKEEEEVEETIEVDEELTGEVKRGPFGVLLTKATQNKSVISVSSRSSKFR